MGFASKYLLKQNGPFFIEPDASFTPTHLNIIIPCFSEPDVYYTIRSILECHQPHSQLTILIVINHSELAPAHHKQQNSATFEALEQWKKNVPDWIQMHVLFIDDLPKKHAGVGWARKIGMDWIISLLNRTNLKNGIIISLDADALVEKNYLQAIEYHFETKNPIAATIYFEHPIEHNENSKGIILYELYMRYYKHALEYVGFPHSIYTVGSCFAVQAHYYVAQGGMNRKKAGEDFYFLQKLSASGLISEIKTTKVTPSARLSDRVPFGTGPVLKAYHNGNRDLLTTYPLDAFLILSDIFSNLHRLYQQKDKLKPRHMSSNPCFQTFAEESDTIRELIELQQNCSSVEIYTKRFYHIFNAFRILKWLNFATQHDFPKADLAQQASKLIEHLSISHKKTPIDPKLMLKIFRDIDKAETFD